MKMYANRYIRHGTLIFSLFLIIIPGCSSVVVEYTSLDKKFHSSVDEPAGYTVLSDRQLIRKGYKKIGILTVIHVYNECKKGECTSKSHTSPSSKTLLLKAAKKGGHLVKARKINKKGKRTYYAQGKCINKQDYYTHHCVRKHMVGGGYYDSYEKVKHSYCIQWEKVKVTQEIIYSTGVVWRKNQE